MARQHTMTPARRAALRKAQLTSARKRRRHGSVPSSLRRAGRQRASYYRNSAALPKNRRRLAKAAVIGTTLAGVGVAAYAGSQTQTYHYQKGMAKSTAKAYRGGKRGPKLTTHRNRVRPIVRANARRKARW